MKKESKLLQVITNKTEQVCGTCVHFIFKTDDSAGIGGICRKDSELTFCYQTCKDYEKQSNDVCPKCGQKIGSQTIGIRGSIVTCPNFCFDELKQKYVNCPICRKGKMSKESYHGTLYIKCDNEECEFEIQPLKLITLILNGWN